MADYWRILRTGPWRIVGESLAGSSQPGNGVGTLYLTKEVGLKEPCKDGSDRLRWASILGLHRV